MRLLFIALFLMAGIAQAQPTKIATLLNQLSAAKSDTTKVRLNNQLATAYYATDVARGTKHARVALALATKAGFPVGKARAFLLLSRSNLILGEFDRGLNRAYSALKIGKQLQDTTILFGAHNMLGIMYAKLNDTVNAKLHYAIGLDLATRTGNKSGLGKTYNNLGNLYEAEGNYETALTFFKKAATLQAALGDVQSQAINLHNIGNVYLNLPKPIDGLPYLYQSIRLNKSIGNQMLLPTTLGSIANIYLETGDTSQALQVAKQSYQASLPTNSSKKISAAAQLMQEIYAALGKYELAYQFMLILAQHEARLDLESQQKVAAEVTAKHEAEAREILLHQLEAEKEKQTLMIAHQQLTLLLSCIIIMLLLVSFLILYFSRKRIHRAHGNLIEVNAKLQQQHVLISAQKDEIAAQALLLQHQKEVVEKHSSFKNKIFSIISHDLRAPFNSVKGILSLVNTPALSEDRIKMIFGLLEKEMVTATNMLQNVLVWAKAQLEASTLSLEEINLTQLADSVINETQVQASIKRIKIYNLIQPSVFVNADKERLSFVFRNLITNAIKFTHPEGEVRLEAEDQQDTVVVHVIDNGAGITAADVKKLFTEKRFTTLGTQLEKGTGLGLTFSKELLQSMNGKISVESQPEVGSIFTIRLPKLYPPENKALTEQISQSAAG